MKEAEQLEFLSVVLRDNIIFADPFSFETIGLLLIVIPG
jgi:hypothetical protein